jgi:2,4-dienoyl-CoA reductase-like NADH-dependent reductase (Old Yellow Enzyme family)
VAPAGTKFAIQLGHAGRKASARRPWEGGGALAPGEDPWPTVAPSAIPSGEGWHMPDALDDAGVERVRNAFVAAAQRAARIGFDVIDLHLAHGYLLHQFQSPLSNRRDDRWGGDAERRRAFPLAVARAVRTAIADCVLLSARISGSDWADGGLTPDDAVIMARDLKAAGVGMVCVSSGGLAPNARIRVGHDYQVPFAARVRREAGIATQAVGLITTAGQADAIVAEGRADMVAMARAFLDDPRWAWQAARELGAEIMLPPQYRRAAPPSWPGRGG